MNQQQAKQLLDDTFNSEFDIFKFSNFLKELVNNSNLYIQDKTQFIEGEFRDYILKVEKLGQYKDKAKKSIEFLAIKLAKHSFLERARIMQRNFIAKWLVKNPAEPEGAIVGFYDDEKDWRFSFVKLEYNLIKDEKGNLKSKKELTPAKRYSYLVGPNEPNHICKKQFVKLLSSENDPLFEEIEMSFGIEKVTKEFFEEYKKRFLDLKKSFEKVIQNDAVVKSEFVKITGEENLERYVVEFSKKLLGQIVFLYFLQKKGWLGVRKNDSGRFKDWGTGPKDFMKRLFNREYCSYNNFFNDVLEPLFYNTLAIKRNDDFSDKFDCKIPFLNGGLFEPLDGYDWMNTNIYIENSIFEDIFRTFDEFNFTVKEDEPLEKEVAVDPEMLGKVFENLLEVTARKSKGAFYTPREIVHYMCQQSLINYLETNSLISRKDIEKFIQEGDSTIDTTLRAKLQINKLEDKLKKGIISATQFQKDVEMELNKIQLPKSIIKEYLLIDNLLQNIKVVDPAVGSGAFPVGMMNEIVKARSILSIYFKTERDISELKRECIENSLYGVDIMPSAVDICQLRFWLSLVVDEIDRKKIKPLPNLDNKIMCGNSLLEEFEGVKLFDDSLLETEVKDIKPELDRIDKEIKELNLKAGKVILGKLKGSIDDIKKAIKKLEREKKKLTAKPKDTTINTTLTNFDKVTKDEAKIKLKKLKAKQKEFFNSFDRDTKKQLKQEIEKLEWELIAATLKQQGNEQALERLDKIMRSKSKPFFLWKLYFAEVFQRENSGFDVVIANPPYVRVQNLSHEEIDIYKVNYDFAYKRLDISLLFFEKSFSILNKSGSLAFISSNQFLVTAYGEKARLGFLKKEIQKMIDFQDLPLFENALTYTSIFLIKNNTSSHQFKFSKVKSIEQFNNYSLDFFDINTLNLNGDYWIFDSPENTSLINKLKSGDLLKKYVKSHYGIITGKDDVLTLSNSDIHKFNLEKEFIRKFILPSDISKWHLREPQTNVIYPYRLSNKTRILTEVELKKDAPNLYAYLIDHRVELKSRKDSRKTFEDRRDWFGLVRFSSIDIFNSEKILSPTIVKKNKFTFDNNKNSFAGGKTVVITSETIELNFLLGLLNSKLSEYFYQSNTPLKAGGYHNYSATFLLEFSIRFNEKIESKISLLVDQILTITKDEDYLNNLDKQKKVKRLEKEIDRLVYELYELTPEEVKIVEEFNKKCLKQKKKKGVIE